MAGARAFVQTVNPNFGMFALVGMFPQVSVDVVVDFGINEGIFALVERCFAVVDFALKLKQVTGSFEFGMDRG